MMPMTRTEGKWAFAHSNWVCTVTEIFDMVLNDFLVQTSLIGISYYYTKTFQCNYEFEDQFLQGEFNPFLHFQSYSTNVPQK